MADFTKELKSDIVEQFKGQPNIEALMDVVGGQLQDVCDFFDALRRGRSLHSAYGAQLDGAGDIVVLTRAEAGAFASAHTSGDTTDDETYRKYLIYKVLKNTNTCTYPDIIKAFKMFWDLPLYYSEDPDEPATMIFKTGTLSPQNNPALLLGAPIIKAAGVKVKIIAITENPEMAANFFMGTALGRGYTVTKLPELQPDYSFAHTEVVTTVAHNITKTTLPELEEKTK